MISAAGAGSAPSPLFEGKKRSCPFWERPNRPQMGTRSKDRFTSKNPTVNSTVMKLDLANSQAMGSLIVEGVHKPFRALACALRPSVIRIDKKKKIEA